MYLSGKKIFLRALESADADLLYKWENDKSNFKFSRGKNTILKKEIREFILNQKDIYLDKQLRLMICTPAKSPSFRRNASKCNTIGCIDLFDFDERNLKAGIGILIAKKYRRNGYGSEALSLLITYSFEILNLHELYCNITDGNEASMNLFQKHKFRITGNKKERVQNEKKPVNEYLLQLTNK